MSNHFHLIAETAKATRQLKHAAQVRLSARDEELGHIPSCAFERRHRLAINWLRLSEMRWAFARVVHKCYTSRRRTKMPGKNWRVNVVLDKALYDSVRRLAAKEEISLSLKIRDLIKDALEAQEDIVLAEVAEEREKTFRRTRGLSHKQVWGS